MKLEDLIRNGTRLYFTLSGNHDEDYFLTENDMSKSHFDLLMSCHHQGQCEEDTVEASKYFEIKNYDMALEHLVGCGLEEEDFKELYDDEDEDSEMVNNEERILQYYLWILAGDIQERKDEDN